MFAVISALCNTRGFRTLYMTTQERDTLSHVCKSCIPDFIKLQEVELLWLFIFLILSCCLDGTRWQPCFSTLWCHRMVLSHFKWLVTASYSFGRTSMAVEATCNASRFHCCISVTQNKFFTKCYFPAGLLFYLTPAVWTWFHGKWQLGKEWRSIRVLL